MTNIKPVFSIHLTNKSRKPKYVIMDKSTHKIIDNNKGQGYKSKLAALTIFYKKYRLVSKKDIDKIKSKKMRRVV
jgi:hypothetical protein